LTRLYTRAHFAAQLEAQVNFAQRHHESFALILLDIDHFKKVNDTYGHSTGDEVLQAVARAVLSGLRRYDSGYRTGGEEMAVLLARTDSARARQIAERLRKRIEGLVCSAARGESVRVTVSCGVAQYRPGESGKDMFNRCDRRLYRAKETGRNRVVAREEAR
jgi:diguanylate cyclase (GGDEF)-like protein